MFREIAVVTFTAGMLGTSAATLYNFNVGTREPEPTPAIERQVEQPGTSDAQAKPKQRDSDLVGFDQTAR